MSVFEEVTTVEVCGSIKRCDIIVLNGSEDKGMVLEPTIRFEICCSQPDDVNIEKCDIILSNFKLLQIKM